MESFDSQGNTQIPDQSVGAAAPAPVIQEMTEVTVENKPSGAYGRFAANILDAICIGLASLPVIAIFELALYGKLSIEGQVLDQLKNNTIVQILAIIGFFGYYLWFNVNKGATPGKSSYKLTIVRYGTLEKIGYGRALVREFGKLINHVPFLGICYFLINSIIILFTKQKRPIYDLIAGTQVIKKPISG